MTEDKNLDIENFISSEEIHKNISTSSIPHHKFKSSKLIQQLQKTIVGQEAALRNIGNVLQYECLQLRKKNGPLGALLWAGPQDTGKTECAFALAEHLFGDTQPLLRIVVDKTIQSIDKVRVLSHKGYGLLLEEITTTPYAIILIDDVQPDAIDWITTVFQTIWQEGIAFDQHNKKYSFQHAMVIITTTIGSESIRALTPTTTVHDTTPTLDLMQLVLNETTMNSSATHHPTPATQDFTEPLWNALSPIFPRHFLQSFHRIPFTVLDPSAIEKITRLKLTTLGKRLQMRYGIELHYAQEVLRFLTHEIQWRKPHQRIEHIFEQHIYECISHEILTYLDDKTKPKELLLQLSAQGQSIRCEWNTSL